MKTMENNVTINSTTNMEDEMRTGYIYDVVVILSYLFSGIIIVTIQKIV